MFAVVNSALVLPIMIISYNLLELVIRQKYIASPECYNCTKRLLIWYALIFQKAISSQYSFAYSKELD